MRSCYYVIAVHNVSKDRREVICDTDYGFVAWYFWWKTKFNPNYRYQRMWITV